MVVDLEGSDVLSDTSDRSLVMVISRLSGNGDMIAVLGIADLEDA